MSPNVEGRASISERADRFAQRYQRKPSKEETEQLPKDVALALLLKNARSKKNAARRR